jgi:acyl-CoA synthetase (AMP-forming)/AMP-acid ligase II
MSARLRDVVTTDEVRRRKVASGGWDASTLVGEVLARASEDAGALAVVDLDGERTHDRAQLVDDALALAARFASRGLQAGDVVSVQLPNRYETVVVALAALRLGLVVNPLLPNYREKELAYVFRKAAPRAVVTPDVYRGHDHVAMVRGLADALPDDVHHEVVDDAGTWLTALRERAETGATSASSAPPAPELPDATAVSEIIFTSGTEAEPKGIMHTEQTTNAGVRAMREFLGLHDGDVVWMPSPVGHSTGFNFGLRLALHLGLPLVLQDRWDPATAIDLVRRFGCTYTLAATTFLQDLVRTLGERGERLDGLDRFCCGGAPVPPELVAAADDRGIGVLRLYGSTEALVVTCNRPGAPLADRLHTDGVPLPGVELRTVRDDGTRCAPGEPGEIEVSSWQGAVGYFEDPQRTAATFAPDGWVRSGDLGVLDESGSLSIVGRKKEIIIRGGLNIAPREIEEMVLAFAEVERCAVIGLPDERLGERVCACVTLRAGSSLSLDELVERLRGAGLATYKLPQVLRVVDALPMTASGKIQKHLLRAEVG